MELQEVVSQLKRLDAPSRRVDGEIAQLLGWTKKTASFSHQQSGEEKQSIVWFPPGTSTEGSIPKFTSSIQDAVNLGQMICPHDVGGFSWEPGFATARFGDRPIYKAATPAIAICIAALSSRFDTAA